MGWASRCDRCGKYFDWRIDTTDGFAFLSHDNERKFFVEDDSDLCPDCVQSLTDWLKEGRRHEK